MDDRSGDTKGPGFVCADAGVDVNEAIFLHSRFILDLQITKKECISQTYENLNKRKFIPVDRFEKTDENCVFGFGSSDFSLLFCVSLFGTQSQKIGQ